MSDSRARIFMKNHAVQIVETLRKHGFHALFVGGCVRDMLMGNAPGDYDIVTDAAPQQVKRIFKRTVPVGVQFGISLVVMRGVKFEVAQFRNMPDSAVKSDMTDLLREDARHRDFTINGMAFDPVTEQVYDFVGGQEDIRLRRIRGIGDARARFLEDRLRTIRAVRFAARFEYAIEAETLDAICEFAPQIGQVSVERVREELLKILTAPRADDALRLLDETGLLSAILPEISALKGVAQPPEFHPEGDVFTHTRIMLQYMNNPSPELAMAALLHDVGKPKTFMITDRIRFHQHEIVGAAMAQDICERLKFSAKSTEKIVALVGNHQKFGSVREMKTSTLKRFLRQEHFADLLELHRLDRLSSRRPLDSYQFCLDKLHEFEHEHIHPPRLISGEDLLALGFQPGPVFKEIMEYVEDAQLEGEIATRDHALELLKDLRDTGVMR